MDNDYGWHQIGVNVKEINIIEGDHLTMLDQQYCDSLAKKILEYCKKL